MSHNFYLYVVIEEVILRHTPRAIIELGTGKGALTTVLGLWGVRLGIPVLSIDFRKLHNQDKIFEALGVQYLQADFFQEETIGLLDIWIEIKSPLLLIIDGGDKEKEFNFFVPRLKEGSIVGVHDLDHEVDPDVIEEIAARHAHPFNKNQWRKNYVQFATYIIDHENG